MGVIKGYPSEEKEDRASVEPLTVNRSGPHRYVGDVESKHYKYRVATEAVSSATELIITSDGTAAAVGDTLHFTDGDWANQEVVVRAVTGSAYTISQKLSPAPSAADNFRILRPASPEIDSDGRVRSTATGGGSGVDPVGLKNVAATTINPATEEKQDDAITALNGQSIVVEEHDYIAVTYVASGNGAGEIETVTYKTGGAAGTTVATLTLAYDVNDKLSTVTKS